MFGPKTIEDLGKKEIELFAQQRSKLSALVAAEIAAGESYLAGDGSADVNVVLKLQAHITALRQAIAAVRLRRPEFIQATFRREGAAAKELAERKRSELAVLIKNCEQLLSKIAELEGVQGKFTAAEVTVSLLTGMGGHEKKSERLASEIAAAESRALEYETRGVPSTGLYDSEDAVLVSDESIVLAVLSDPSVGPPAEEVFAWLQSVSGSVPTQRLDVLPRRVRIAWKDGRIDRGQSYLFIPALAPGMISHDGRGEVRGVDVAGGTFRAPEGQAA